jgi:hypothetical protein
MPGWKKGLRILTSFRADDSPIDALSLVRRDPPKDPFARRSTGLSRDSPRLV